MTGIFHRAFAPGPRVSRGARVGAAAVPLAFPSGLQMAGYSLMGHKGAWAGWDLKARALVFEDDHGHAVAFVAADLMSASRYLHEHTARLTRQGHSRIDVHELVLLGTHTHSAPGNFYGNSLYDTVAQAGFGGFNAALADALVTALANAVEQAWASAVPGHVSIQTARAWGVCRNRSLVPFEKNDEAAGWSADPSLPGYRPQGAGGLSKQQLAVDPRVQVLSAFADDGSPIGCLATFACHNTALGTSQKYYAPDWTGIAARTLETATPGWGGMPVALVALSGAGDISPTPPDDGGTFTGPRQPGADLARFVAGAVSDAVRGAVKTPGPLHPIELQTWHHDWRPTAGATVPGAPETELADWMMGAPALGGAEDGRSDLHPRLAREGMRGGHFPTTHPQYPKVPAGGVAHWFAKRLLGVRPSPVHPLHVVMLAGHAFATAPGEPTVCAAHQLATSVRAAAGAASASVLGFAGDYAGYFTTRREFYWQHYEGASTLYGGQSASHLAALLARMVQAAPFTAPAPQTVGFELTA